MAWPVSDRFLSALTTSHEVISRVDVLQAGVVVREGLPVVSGSVEVSETSGIRRRLSGLTVTRTDGQGGSDLNPRDLADLLAPFGTELAVYSGLRTPDGIEELVPVGVFGIRGAGTGSWFGPVVLSGRDRAQRVADARFTTARQVSGSTTVVQAITNLLLEVDPTWEVYDLTLDTSRASRAVYERDRAKAVEDLARSIGAEVVPDPAGRWLIRPTAVVPTLAEVDAAAAEGFPVVWHLEGGDGGALVDIGSNLSAEGVHNAVVAIAEPEAGAPPITATARITSGPLAWDGPFGQRPRFYASPVLRTLAHCQSAAASMLPRATAFARELSPLVLPNPAMDVGDWAVVTEPARTLDDEPLRTPAVVRGFTVSLEEAAMPVQVRVAGEQETIEGVS